MPFDHPKFNQMLQEARHYPAFQQTYFCFETGNIFGPYEFTAHRHAENHMLDDFMKEYPRHVERNRNIIHTHHIANVFIYTVNSPCDEPNHNCGRLLLGMFNHFPVNNKYHLGYSRVWDGLPRDKAEDREKIKVRSLAILERFKLDPNWTVREETK